MLLLLASGQAQQGGGGGPVPGQLPFVHLLSAPLLDDARRPDQAPLTGAWTGPIDPSHALLRLQGNNIRSNTTGAGSMYWNPLTGVGPACEVWAIINPGAAVRLYGRIQNPGSSSMRAYVALFDAGLGTVSIYRADPGSPITYVQLGRSEWRASTSPERVALTMVDTEVKAWYRDSHVLTVTDSTPQLQAAGRIGLGVTGNDAPKVAAFGGGDMPIVFPQGSGGVTRRTLVPIKCQVNWYANSWNTDWTGL